MSLSQCTECRNEVSTKATKCPNCGAPIKKKGKVGCLGSIIIIIVALILIGKISNFFEEMSSAQEDREQTKNYSQEERQKDRKQAKKYAQIEKEIFENQKIKEHKKKQEKAAFKASIEKRYKALVAAFNSKNYDEATKLLDPFITHNELNYKDVDTIRKKVEIDSLVKKAKVIPISRTAENLVIYQKLLELDPSNSLYKKKVAYYSAEYRKVMKKANSDLELLIWHWSSEHGYVTAEGQVKNISGIKMERVKAMVTWYDNNGNMVTSDSSLIEYDPIMPGQISPFKVIERFNPLMKKANLEFKFMRGNQISTYYEKD